jgi:hypothetical protein
MVSSGLLRRVALVRTDISEEPGASIIKVTKIGELAIILAATSNRRTLRRNAVFLRSVRRLLVAASIIASSPIFVTLMMEAPGSPETSVLTRATRRNNPEDTILHDIHLYVDEDCSSPKGVILAVTGDFQWNFNKYVYYRI